jgi:hypothetical protein
MDHNGMPDYDRQAWAEVSTWLEKRLHASDRRLVPRALREKLEELRENAQRTAEKIPGAEWFHELFLNALDGLLTLVNRLSEASLRRDAVVEGFAKRGHVVTDLADIRKLDLRDIDKVKPRLDLHYALGSAVEGAAAGFAVSGGEIVATGGTILGVGAGVAPGAGTVVGVMAADAAAVLVATTRVVAHTAAYYGYDTELPEERIFALGVMNFGLAEQAGKGVAYIELNKIVQDLARRRIWEKLNQNGVTQIVKAVYKVLGMRITQQKLGQAVPIVGILIGSGLNARLLARVGSDADHLYRERFLREKYDLPPTSDAATPKAPDRDDSGGVLPIIDIVVHELEAESAEAASPERSPDD